MAKRRPRADRPVSTSTGAGRPAAATRRAGIGWRGGLLLVLAAVAAGASAWYLQQRSRAARLPSLPDLSRHSPAVKEHLLRADRTARSIPFHFAAARALCLAYHANSLYDSAVSCYTALDGWRSDDWQSTYYRALAQSARGRNDESAADLREAAARAPDFAPAWLRLGEAEFKKGNLEAAGDAWRRAEARPEAPVAPPPGAPVQVPRATLAQYAAMNLARIDLARGEFADARTILEGVTAGAPRLGPAFRLLGDAYAGLGRRADAAQAQRQADALPSFGSFLDPMVATLVGESRDTLFLLQQAAETDAASNAAWQEYLVRRAWQFDPDNPDVVYQMASVLRRQGRDDQALGQLQRYQQLVGDDPLVLAEIGSYLSQLGRFDAAEPMLRRAARGPSNANVHYDLGVVLTGRQQMGEAAAEFQRALALNQHHVSARLNLAVLLLLQRRFDDAARELERVLQIDPQNAKAHTNLGVVLAEQGRRADAARHFREALRLDPGLTQAADGLRALGL